MKIEVRVSTQKDALYAETICRVIEESAKIRGTGIAKRDTKYVEKKLIDENAVVAFVDGQFAGFCYIEFFDSNRYISNSGLIVVPDFRQLGLAKLIKKEIFKLSRKKYPKAKLFGITTSLPVMKINTKLGYTPVTFSELTTSETFWNTCHTCPNFDILQRNKCKMCLCTGMLYDPEVKKKNNFLNKQKQNVKNIIKKSFISL